jgi:hypothetical protein
MIGGTPPIYRLDLTAHQRTALLTVISGYITSPGAVEVSIDAATGEEIPIGDLLALVLHLDPVRDETGDAVAEQILAGWTPIATLAELRARYGDRTIADALPRAVLYLDLGYLTGQLERLRHGNDPEQDR